METTNKIITLASFIYTDKIDSFKKYLKKRFKINEENVFIYSYEEKNKNL